MAHNTYYTSFDDDELYRRDPDQKASGGFADLIIENTAKAVHDRMEEIATMRAEVTSHERAIELVEQLVASHKALYEYRERLVAEQKQEVEKLTERIATIAELQAKISDEEQSIEEQREYLRGYGYEDADLDDPQTTLADLIAEHARLSEELAEAEDGLESEKDLLSFLYANEPDIRELAGFIGSDDLSSAQNVVQKIVSEAPDTEIADRFTKELSMFFSDRDDVIDMIEKSNETEHYVFAPPDRNLDEIAEETREMRAALEDYVEGITPADIELIVEECGFDRKEFCDLLERDDIPVVDYGPDNEPEPTMVAVAYRDLHDQYEKDAAQILSTANFAFAEEIDPVIEEAETVVAPILTANNEPQPASKEPESTKDLEDELAQAAHEADFNNTPPNPSMT